MKKINVNELLTTFDKYIKSERKLPLIKSYKKKEKINITYPLIPHFAYAHIYYDVLSDDLIYELLEPELSYKELRILPKIKSYILDSLYSNPEDYIGKPKEYVILEMLTEYINKNKMDIESKEDILKLYYYLWRDLIGLGKIEPLFYDTFIEDISCDGYNTYVFVHHSKFGILRTNIIFSERELDDLILKIAQKTGRNISYSEPLLDATLPDGSRVNATYSREITTRGPTFTIRKFKKELLTIADLIDNNTLSIEIAAYLWWAVENKANILIAGGTSSGKTTLLNALSLFIPPNAKIVSIEDTRELQLYQENWIPAISRKGFLIGGNVYGEITLYDLLKEAMRQNPDYLIVGEVRGKEAFVMFQAMASGHATLSTIHSDSLPSLIRRLEAEPIKISHEYLHLIDMVIFMTKAPNISSSARRVREIVEIGKPIEKEELNTYVVCKWNPFLDDFHTNIEGSLLLEKMKDKSNIDEKDFIKNLTEKKRILKYIVKRKYRSFTKVSEIFKLYYTDKDTLLRKIR